MPTQSVMQQVLGKQWAQLPSALQQHYSANHAGEINETGYLNIEYPRWMQWPLNGLRLMGALVNRAGQQVTTNVQRQLKPEGEYWQRALHFDDGQCIPFSSHTQFSQPGELIEYTNALLGLRMQVTWKEDHLSYQSQGYILKLGSLKLTIPEWLALGYASIKETAVDEQNFAMDFRLRHPLFGQIFRYSGQFSSQPNNP